jgi:preprotein translocase subunit SecA
MKTLEDLSSLLVEDERLVVLFACVACNDQHLPSSALRALENIMEHGDEALCATAVSALSRASENGQLLASHIVPLAESAFIRHVNEREELGAFLHQLLKKQPHQPLSLTGYETLQQIILSEQEELDTQDGCYNILAESARKGHEIPVEIMDTLLSVIDSQPEPIKEKACHVLMICLAQACNRRSMTPTVLAKAKAFLETILLEKNLNLNQYAACALGHLMCEALLPEATDAADQAMQKALLVQHLSDSLIYGPTLEYAVFPLYHILNHEPYGLLGDALTVLGQMIADQKNNVSLRKKAIELMGLSARNNKNAFSGDELKVLEGVLNERKPALTVSCLTALTYHLNNLYGANVLPHKIMKHVMQALNHEETALEALHLLNQMLEKSESSDQATVLDKFLVIAKERRFQCLVQSREVCRHEVEKLLILAQQDHPEAVQSIREAFDAPPEALLEETVDLLPDVQKTQGKALTITELLEQLKKDNAANPEILGLLHDGTLKRRFDAIHEASERDAVLCSRGKPIKNWTESDCLQWSKALKAKPSQAKNPAFLAEIIAVVSRGNVLATTHQPRPIQLFSLLLLLDANDYGRLAQIATGEGKSTIVALLAAIKALQGETVDVVSSSPLLAFRDATEKADFFKLFDLSVASNWYPDESKNKMFRGLKSCYSANIVYGDASNFQFDLLRHEYKEENTRGERAYQTVIVDEVDSMLIDETSKIASLGSNNPLMSELEVLFSSTWIELCRRQVMLQKDDFFFPVNEKTGEPYTKTDYLEAVVERLLTKMLEDSDSPAQIPKHLEAYALSQVSYWAKAAVMASDNYCLGRDYVITKQGDHEIIAPVDYENTGVVRANSVWENGLQQFLQLKHSLAFTAENLTASFISNREFFKRYDKNIYGLTGTLGAPDSQALLKEVYEIDLAFVPTYKAKQFKELPGILEETTEAWFASVVASVKSNTESGRAALVICKSINEAHAVEAALRQANISKIKRYTRSDSDENLVVSDKVVPGDVIVATNLAGRGTDIKISDEVEENGGLYECLTFLPQNRRIEAQAFGRTARQGQKGSAQLVLNKQEVLQALTALDPESALGDADSVEDIKAWRDAIETKTLEDLKAFELPKLIFKDVLFTNFCTFMRYLRALDNKEAKLDEVEEQWGFWLKKTLRKMESEVIVNKAEILADLERFKSQVEEDFIDEELQNPSAWVKLGIHHGNGNAAKIAYEKSIARAPQSISAAQAHYRLAHFYVARQNKGAAIAELKAAKSVLIDDVIPRLETAAQLPLFYQRAEAGQKISGNIQQIHRRIHLLKIQIAHIDRDISVLQHAHRAIETTATKGLKEFFGHDKAPDNEITALDSVGLPHLFEIREAPKKKKRGFKAWVRRVCVAIFGVC